MDKNILQQKRHRAAIASGGISSEPIYLRFEQVINQYHLQGECLDFGAGTGKFTQKLRLMPCFSKVVAIDILPRPKRLDHDIPWFTTDLNQPVNIPSNSFDVIFSVEVIEHLENPRATVREWFRLLRSGGTLVFSTPNNESWRSLLSLVIQGHFVAFTDTSYPAHITPLIRKDIERILQESGFVLHQFIFTNMGGIPKLPKLTWQSISFNLLQGLRYSDNVLAIAQKP